MKSPEQARTAMVERLRAAGILETAAVERAMAAVPRHEFVEDVSIGVAYGPTALLVKRAQDGETISTASQPEMVAEMLELGDIQPGDRVLEIGTATGYNAALLATLVGAEGMVVTIELEADLAATAKERLRRLGFADVVVIAGDGAVGHPAEAPYDLIIATAGAAELPDAWVEQVREGGRLVVPIVDAHGSGDVLCLVKRETDLEEIARIPCRFLPLREG